MSARGGGVPRQLTVARVRAVTSGTAGGGGAGAAVVPRIGDAPSHHHDRNQPRHPCLRLA